MWCSISILFWFWFILTFVRFHSYQENIGKREVNAANCETVFLSAYVVISWVKTLKFTIRTPETNKFCISYHKKIIVVVPIISNKFFASYMSELFCLKMVAIDNSLKLCFKWMELHKLEFYLLGNEAEFLIHLL